MDRFNGPLPVEDIDTTVEWIDMRERLGGEVPLRCQTCGWGRRNAKN